MPADREPQYAKHQRQRQRQTWLEQGLDIDQIARRFRQTYNVGALTAYRWANNQSQLDVANTYSERFLDPDQRLYPQRVSEYEKWPHEHGGREPPLSVLEHLAALYHTTPTRLITAVLDGPQPEEAATSSAAQAAATHGEDGAGGEDDHQTVSELPQRLSAWGPEELEHDLLDRLALKMRPTAADPAKVEHLEQVTAIHRKLYHSSTPSELIDALRGHLSAVITALRSTERTALRRRLASIAGETAGHVAWLSYDLNHDRGAARYYMISASAMRQAGNPALDAYVQGFKSQVRSSQGEFEQARLLAEDASRKAARSGTATLRSWLWGLRGRALAELGDTTGCAAALKHAEKAIWQARPEEDPPWLDVFDPARFSVLAGSCYRKLGQTEAAQELLEDALAQIGARPSRHRSAALLELASVELDRGDLERACRLAGAALEILSRVGSLAGVERVVQIRSAVDTRGGTPALADLDEQFAAVL